MKSKKYGAFTLVEMLIVMGILSVLMAIGVSVARFAIQRANNIQHQNAVDQLYQAMQSFYTDNRRYPYIDAGGGDEAIADEGIDDALNTVGEALDLYVDTNFDGGSSSKFYIFVENTDYPQEFLACVSFDDPDNITATGYGGYCNGNGFGVIPFPNDAAGVGFINGKILDGADFFAQVEGGPASGVEVATQEWDGKSWD